MRRSFYLCACAGIVVLQIICCIVAVREYWSTLGTTLETTPQYFDVILLNSIRVFWILIPLVFIIYIIFAVLLLAVFVDIEQGKQYNVPLIVHCIPFIPITLFYFHYSPVQAVFAAFLISLCLIARPFTNKVYMV